MVKNLVRNLEDRSGAVEALSSGALLLCTRCQVVKPRSEFGTHTSSKKWCKVCRSEADRIRRFGIEPEDYDKMLADQDGVCAICKKPETRITATGKVADLAVDHDHACCPGRTSCGKCIRGLLCDRCNRSIGLLEDNAEYFKSAITYIRRTKKNDIRSRSTRRRGRLGRIFDQASRLVGQG